MSISYKRISIGLAGLRPIMFDKYPGDNETRLPPEEKMYFSETGKTLVLPVLNLWSFLTATNTRSAPKVLFDSRKYKDIIGSIQAYVSLPTDDIPFMREGKPIVFGGIKHGRDESSGVYIRNDVARVEKGIPNPTQRPVLSLPWRLDFDLDLVDNKELPESRLRDIFERGGLWVGLGSFRGMFGKFGVCKWDVTEG